MGSVDRLAYRDDGEGPIHVVELSPFRIAPHAVTNGEFAAFVASTGHVTEAEQFGWSFVFAGLLPDDFPPTAAVASAPWWRQVEGADWCHPEGPASDVERPRRPPGRARVVARRRGVLRVERDAPADGGRVGDGRAAAAAATACSRGATTSSPTAGT